MMCKAKAWVLALTAGLLLLLIPAQARADVTRLLILNDEQTSETSAAATDVPTGTPPSSSAPTRIGR